MQIGGESNLALLMIFAIGGLIVGALLMYLVLNAVRGQKDAGEVVHTQPIPKTDVDKAQLVAKIGDLEIQSSDAMADKLPEEIDEPNSVAVEEAGKPEEISANVPEIISPFPDMQSEFSFWRSQDGRHFLVNMDETWHENIQSMKKDQLERFQNDLTIGASWLGLSLLSEKQIRESTKTDPNAINSDQLKVSVNKSSIPISLDVPKRKTSIVEQVDDILQTILHEEGLYNVNIRLTEMVNRGLVVWVGKEFFEGIDAVPDPAVKDYIRQAVKRWEASDTSI
jgi:hypothetical protein